MYWDKWWESLGTIHSGKKQTTKQSTIWTAKLLFLRDIYNNNLKWQIKHDNEKYNVFSHENKENQIKKQSSKHVSEQVKVVVMYIGELQIYINLNTKIHIYDMRYFTDTLEYHAATTY